MLKGPVVATAYYLKSCEMPSRVAHSEEVFIHKCTVLDVGFLTRAGRPRKRVSSGKNKNKRSRTDEPREEGGPDEAATFIAETSADLARLARRHKLDMLSHLLGMAQMEAEEHLRLRSKKKLS
jgi:hypothetical protein